MILMHENIPVADVDIYLGNISNIKSVITPEHLPIGTNHKPPMLQSYLNSWLKDRAIPFTRQSLELYTKYFGCAPLEAAQIFGSFSLTDHYWFKENGNTDKWEDLCFQENGFSNHFSDFFIDVVSGNTPDGNYIPKIPDVNTDGVLPKIWIQDGEDFKLIKFGEREETRGCHILSANEVACSKIAKLMNLNAVEYRGISLPGISNPVCKCSNFIPKDMEFITLNQVAKSFAGNGKKLDLYGTVCEMGFKQEIEDMLRFFFLIHNKDGHTKNCGFLRNAKTLEIEKFAPLFDNGCSLNYDGMGSLDQSVKPFRATRLEQLALVKNIGKIPSFEEMTEIIKETYDNFNIPDMQLDLALQDLIETCNEWTKISEKEDTKEEKEYD